MATSEIANTVRWAGALKRSRGMLDKDLTDAEPATKRTKAAVHQEKRAKDIAGALLCGYARLASTPYGPTIRVAWQAWKRHAEFLPYKNSAAALKRKHTPAYYARKVRRSFCHQFLEKITAQEIRDQIYEYLVEPSTVTLHDRSEILRYEYGKVYTNTGNHRQACLDSQDRESWSFELFFEQPYLPEIWLCENAGHEILVELVKHWYRVNTFAIKHPDHLSLIADFAIQDRWQLDIVPRNHVKNLTFPIHLAFVARDERGKSPPQLPLLREGLEEFLQFNPGTKIKLSISSEIPRSKFRTSAFARHKIVSWVTDKGNVWTRDVAEILKLVEDLESGLFDIFRKLCAAGLLLVFTVDAGLEIKVNEEKEITYDMWAEKILAYQQELKGGLRRRYYDSI